MAFGLFLCVLAAFAFSFVGLVWHVFSFFPLLTNGGKKCALVYSHAKKFSLSLEHKNYSKFSSTKSSNVSCIAQQEPTQMHMSWKHKDFFFFFFWIAHDENTIALLVCAVCLLFHLHLGFRGHFVGFKHLENNERRMIVVEISVDRVFKMCKNK